MNMKVLYFNYITVVLAIILMEKGVELMNSAIKSGWKLLFADCRSDSNINLSNNYNAVSLIEVSWDESHPH